MKIRQAAQTRSFPLHAPLIHSAMWKSRGVRRFISAAGRRSPWLALMLEIFHLAQTLLRGRLALVRPAKILALFREHFVAFFGFTNHGDPPSNLTYLTVLPDSRTLRLTKYGRTIFSVSLHR